MEAQGLYFPTGEFKTLVTSCGGEWNDRKERPLVCLVRSLESDKLFWAIPMGDMAHRSEAQRLRIDKYLNLPKRDIRSCYYHVAMTDKESLFFISDAVPITDKYIEHAYEVGGCGYIIKNPATVAILRSKLFRILAAENRNPNSFRQHITAVKQCLLAELDEAKN